MAGDRTLKLSILGDVSNLNKSLTQGSKDVESFGTQVGEWSKKAVLAMAAIGAAAGAMAVDLVKAAAEDEAAQRKLAETLKNTTTATDAQIAAVEDYISKTALAVGVTDDKLRPALSRLLRSTNDVESAQKLLNLALDITAATGKPLQTVVDALGKAYDGNTASLGRLGLGVDANILKGGDFNKIYETLQTTFGTFAENEAATLEGKFRILNIAVDESKEAIGAALLPAAEKLSDWLLETGVPALEAFIGGLTGDTSSLGSSLTESQKKALAWGENIKTVATTVVKFKDQLILLAGVIGTVFVVSKISAGVTATIALISTLIKAYNALKTSAIIAGVASAFALNPLLGVGAAALAAGVLSAANALARKYDSDAAALEEMKGGANLGDRPLGGKIGGVEIPTTTNTGGGLFTTSTSGGSKTSGSTTDTGQKTDWSQAMLDAVDTLTDAQKAASKSLDTLEKLNPNLAIAVQGGTFQAPTTDTGFNAGSFRMAESRGNTYNVTVNGAMDANQTARQIVTLLNNEASVSGTFSGIGVSRFTTRAE